MSFKKGDRVRFTEEAIKNGAIEHPSFGWVIATPKGEMVHVQIDGFTCSAYFHETFLELVARFKGMRQDIHAPV